MNSKVISTLKTLRSIVNRLIKPRSSYWIAPLKRDILPISGKFGYDRGKPIDRFWIENFLETNKQYVKGICLEVTDRSYTTRFGGDKVKKSDVLDIDPKNKAANILGDLRNLHNIKSNTYDCIILTHVLGLVDDCGSAVNECFRILKPGGVLLFTSSCLGPVLGEQVYWRFTGNSVKYLFSKHFKNSNLVINSYGNALAGQAFLVGMSQEDLTREELEFNDPRFPCIVTLRAQK